MSQEFWDYLNTLVEESQIQIDRPKGTIHPRYPNTEYPVDYGYLSGTTAADGGGIDIWLGTAGKGAVVGVLCTVDLLKKDTELKIVYECTEDEILSVVNFVNSGEMRAIYIKCGQ
jgi:inorganic pyrophosphatase